jgi:hypothetical protein
MFGKDNLYKIKWRSDKQGFLCKLEWSGGKLNESHVVEDVAWQEREIKAKLWELYHKNVKY